MIFTCKYKYKFSLTKPVCVFFFFKISFYRYFRGILPFQIFSGYIDTMTSSNEVAQPNFRFLAWRCFCDLPRFYAGAYTSSIVRILVS